MGERFEGDLRILQNPLPVLARDLALLGDSIGDAIGQLRALLALGD